VSEDQEKTEEATPERRKKARDEGQFPRGKDAGNTAGSLFVLLTLVGLAGTFRERFEQFALRCFYEPSFLVDGDYQALVNALGVVLMVMIFPVAAAAALGAAAAGVAEAGYEPRLELAGIKWERLEPFGKLKQMFSPQHALVNTTLQLGRVFAVGIVAYLSIEDAFPRLLRLSRTGFAGAMMAVTEVLLRLAVWSSIALVVLVLVDYIYNKIKHEKNIMMSRHDIKEEMKQQDGDPRVKAQQRARAREMLKRGIAQAVRDSDFIIANPTHVSVALRYRPDEGAPVVAAKGYDEIALHIRSLAKEHRIPIVENVPLARALAKRVKVGRAIPIDLYAAVAEVLAFVYRLKRRGMSA
jgi:flagellar biosynthesis protein FlhB